MAVSITPTPNKRKIYRDSKDGLIRNQGDQMKIINRVVIHFIYLPIIALMSACGMSENPHLKNADAWLELGKYAEALSEYQQVASEDPKDLQAHIGIIRSFVGMEHYVDAIDRVELVRKIDPNSAESIEIIKYVEASIIDPIRPDNTTVSMPSESYLINRIDLLSSLGSKDETLSILKIFMAHSSNRVAEKAESVLKILAPAEIQPVLVSHLDAENTDLKLRSATRLWNEYKMGKAGEVILATIEERLLLLGKQEHSPLIYESSKYLDSLGYPISKDLYRKAFSSHERFNDDFLMASLKRVGIARDPSMKDLVVELVKLRKSSTPTEFLRSNLIKECLTYLAIMDDATFVPEIKVALAKYWLDGSSDTVLATNYLSEMDGNKWKYFHYRYVKGSWPEATKLQIDINKKRGDMGGSGQPVVDESAEDLASVEQLFAALGPMNMRLKLSRKFNVLNISKVVVHDADRLRWIATIKDVNSNNVIGQADLVFRATGDPNRAWVLTKVENLHMN